MIRAVHLSKSYRVGRGLEKKPAVDDISFEVETGKVTGFLGPNGAGKSTTMRLMLELDRGGGITTFDGRKLSSHKQPSKVVGVLLEAKAFHATRTARNHLRILADEGDMPLYRVDEVLDTVGLKEVANKHPGKFSLGMSQRLGIAAAILGKPKYLLLDEPANGLDPEGIAWLRKFIRDYASQGNGVFVSSHLLSEMSQMADNVVVIGKGRLIASTSIQKLVAQSEGGRVLIKASNSAKLQTALKAAGLKFDKSKTGLAVYNSSTDEVGKLAYSAGVAVLELSKHTASLEEAFFQLTEDSQEFKARAERGGER